MNDRFGNLVDPKVGYARGAVLQSASDEAARTLHGRQLVRQRIERFGHEGLFNLSGLIRGFILDESHLLGLRSQFHYYATYDGWPEAMAVQTLGGDPARHGGLIMNRVSAATFALMGSVLRPGDVVLSVVPAGRAHPSVERAVSFCGGTLHEVIGPHALEVYLAEHDMPAWAVVTPFTHQKFHFALPDLVASVQLLAASKVPVFLDDAHMSARVAGLGQPVSFEVGPIAASVVSTDKHMFGPRAGALVAELELLARIRAFAFEFGLEAQFGQAVAAGVAMERYDSSPIVEAVAVGRELLRILQLRFGDVAYSTGVGAAINEQDVLDLAVGRASTRKPVRLAPVDAASVLAMSLLVDFGIATIPAVGMPGSSPALRLMVFPDGRRFGVEAVGEAVDAALDTLAQVIHDPDAAAGYIFGSEVVHG